MQLFYFPGTASTFHLMNASLATRLSFLLADAAVVSPHTEFMMDIGAVCEGRSRATKMKLALNYFAIKEPEKTAEVREMAKLIKKVQAQKRKTKEDLLLIRKFENLSDTYYESYLLHFETDLAPYGITNLKGLLDHEAVFEYFYSDTTPEAPVKGDVALSELLQMLGDSQDRADGVEDIAFLLPADFFEPAFLPEEVESLATALPGADAAPADAQAIWAEPLVKLPDIVGMSLPELEAVRHQLREPGTAFRAAIDAWLADCHHERQGIRERAFFFTEAIRPAAQALQKAIDENKILDARARVRDAQNNQLRLYLFAAEMPLQAMWAFYEKAGSLNPETIEKLRAVWDTRGQKRFPVFILGLDEDVAAARAKGKDLLQQMEAAKAAESSGETPPASVRKSLDLGD